MTEEHEQNKTFNKRSNETLKDKDKKKDLKFIKNLNKYSNQMQLLTNESSTLIKKIWEFQQTCIFLEVCSRYLEHKN